MIVKIRALLFGMLLLLTIPTSATAHEDHPGVLALEELSGGSFQVRWSPPRVLQSISADQALRFPSHCQKTQGFGLECGERGLLGPIEIRPIEGGPSRIHLSIEWKGGARTVHVLRPGHPKMIYGAPERAPASAWWTIGRDYVWIGVEHILEGIDHLLFVLGLLLIVGFRSRLVGTVTAFTLSHSVALAGSVLGAWSLPSRPVEVTIALSIVLLAVEAARPPLGITHEKPWVPAFAFGLLHGLGFAGALSEVGLPPHHTSWALFSFNLGVELGQLAFLAVLGLLFVALRHLKAAARPRLASASRRAVIYAMGGYAAYLSLDRFAQIIA